MTSDEFRAILPELVRDYKPAEQSLMKIKRVYNLMVIGPSGSGKTTLINKLGIPYVPSDTTRPPRPHEIEGVDFYFHSDLQKTADNIKNGEFLQVAVDSGGDLKATKASSYPDSGWVVMAVVADVIPIFRKLGFKRTVSAFIVPPSFEEWQRRLSLHHLSKDQLEKRLAEGLRSFEFALSDPEVHLILNDDINDAEKQLTDLIEGHFDQEREKKAKSAAEQILHRLKLVDI